MIPIRVRRLSVGCTTVRPGFTVGSELVWKGAAVQDEDRTEWQFVADERATLAGFLDRYRDTLEWKCTGLTPEQLSERAVPPSTMSLLGLVRHMAEVERGWFRRGLAGEDVGPLYYTEQEPDRDFDDVDGATADDVEGAFAVWRFEVKRAREISAATPMDRTFISKGSGTTISHRWLLVHMIEEYARHNGHADLLRERIDGEKGY
jgi:uncharacterized damage-inducible protein DinB